MEVYMVKSHYNDYSWEMGSVDDRVHTVSTWGKIKLNVPHVNNLTTSQLQLGSQKALNTTCFQHLLPLPSEVVIFQFWFTQCHQVGQPAPPEGLGTGR